MRLVRIDGMESIINMDNVVTLDVYKGDNDHWAFYVNGKRQGQFESTYEKTELCK